MKQSTLSIHSENILPIIKKWLYSSRDIFARELVSNACDAIKKLRMLRECGQAEAGEPFEIHVRIDREKRTLTFSDNGIGMTEAEVEKYIAQIAFSGAEEFVSKYKELSNIKTDRLAAPKPLESTIANGVVSQHTTPFAIVDSRELSREPNDPFYCSTAPKMQSEKDPIIGHFGLGFYSAYMVAKTVEIDTLSFQPAANPVRWSCDGSSTYLIGAGERQTIGTDVILHLDDTEYLEESKVRELLQRYCSFMPDPIFLNGKPLHNRAPLWLKQPSDCTDQEYREFYRQLYPMEPDPIFWIHLNVDYPFRLKGILYFPKMVRRYDANEGTIRLYCNRVFVADNCREILPDFLTALRGAIDSPDIPLNVSRSYLQVDANVRQLGAHLSKKVSDRLCALFKSDREAYASFWSEIEPIVKLGLLQDDKFCERIQEALIWKSSNGSWTTVQEYLDRAKEKKVYYSSDERSSAIRKAFLAKGIELILAGAPIDAAVIGALENKMPDVKFQRIDSELDAALIDESREKSLLDAEGKSAAARLADFFRSSLAEEKLEIEAKSLASEEWPAVVLLDEETRRMRDTLILTQGKAMPHLAKKKFVVNSNNKLVQAALKLQPKHPVLAQQLARQIYDLSLLSQKELEASKIDEVVAQSHKLLEILLTHYANS